MKNDFKKMEEEMDKLSEKMSAITEFNDKISNTLQDKRLQITKLSGVHALLRKVRKISWLTLHQYTSVSKDKTAMSILYNARALR